MSEHKDDPRYAVGIDLGTTHSVLSYVDLNDKSDHPEVEILPVAQLVNPGAIEEKEQLPSFMYQHHDSEFSEGNISLPWTDKPDALVGSLARDYGTKTPIRMVSSAKSWLCHGKVNCRDAFLPLHSPDEVKKVSPLEASYQYLNHLRQAWDFYFSDAPLVDQEVIITVPASFDPAARDLTVEAAGKLGLNNLTLLEEPQAALYSWIERCKDQWRDQVDVGDIVLVVDVGGGTTDLSLVAVTEDEGNLSLNRVAVGNHILLGGDNMDLALAYRVKAKLTAEGKELQPWQIQGITQGCRAAKETLLTDPEVNAVPITVPSRGSRLLGGTLRTELTREEVRLTLLDGFFPQVSISEHPKQAPRTALTQMGLPYAQDAGITRHLASFLSSQQNAVDNIFGSQQANFIKPTAILLNGGVLKAPIVAERLLNTINQWLTDTGAPPAKLLDGLDLDLAVSRGAAYYGHVRQGNGVRIRGGIASAYYVGIESSMPAIPGMEPPLQALCVAPFGMEEGVEAEVPSQEFGLVVGEPVHFRFFGSTIRRDDTAGTLLDYWDPSQLEELPTIEATLAVDDYPAGEVIPVRLASRVTELGTLRLEAISVRDNQRWQVEFEVRD